MNTGGWVHARAGKGRSIAAECLRRKSVELFRSGTGTSRVAGSSQSTILDHGRLDCTPNWLQPFFFERMAAAFLVIVRRGYGVTTRATASLSYPIRAPYVSPLVVSSMVRSNSYLGSFHPFFSPRLAFNQTHTLKIEHHDNSSN